jgi:hypothetical protein
MSCIVHVVSDRHGIDKVVDGDDPEAVVRRVLGDRSVSLRCAVAGRIGRNRGFGGGGGMSDKFRLRQLGANRSYRPLNKLTAQASWMYVLIFFPSMFILF